MKDLHEQIASIVVHPDLSGYDVKWQYQLSTNLAWNMSDWDNLISQNLVFQSFSLYILHYFCNAGK